MEPPVADVPARSGPQPHVLTPRLAAAGAAAALALTSTGSVVVIAALLLLSTLDATVAVVAVAAVVVQLARFGTASMPAAAGAQAVLAPAVFTGPVLGGLASICLLASLVMAAPSRRLAVPIGLLAAAVAAGPSALAPGPAFVRIVALVAIVVGAWSLADRVHNDGRPAVALAMVASVLAVMSRASGGVHWSALVTLGPLLPALAIGAVGAVAGGVALRRL